MIISVVFRIPLSQLPGEAGDRQGAADPCARAHGSPGGSEKHAPPASEAEKTMDATMVI